MRRTPADDNFRRRREKILRRLLCRCPWWIDGHLHLGLLQIELAEVSMHSGRADPAGRFRLLETMRVSAEAVEQLVGERGAGGEPPAEILEARFLKSMERYYAGDLEAAFEQLTELLLPKFAQQLRGKIWLLVHEYAGYSAMAVRGADAAAALFRAIPSKARSDEISKMLEAHGATSAL